MRGRFWIIVGAGVLLLLVAALVSAFQGWGGRASTLLLSGGGVAWTLALVLSWREVNAYLARRSARYGLNALVLSFLVAVILLLLGVLADRHGWRLDFTANRDYSLSDKTLKVLEGLPVRIDLHVFYGRNERDAVLDLLHEYTRRSGRLRVHMDDLNKDPELAERYGVTSLGVIVFDSGAKTERIQSLSEEDVTNALIKVSRPGRKKVYFLTEHGEKELDSKGMAGFATAAAALQRENYDPEPLSLARGGRIPADCDVLVVAGPKSRLLDGERVAIQRFLESGRRLLLLFDPRFESGLESYVTSWGIRVGNDRVVDPSPTGQLLGRGPTTPLVNRYGVHPITKQFRLPTYFELARSVGPSEAYTGRVQSAVLAFTGEQSWADGDLHSGQVRFGDPNDVSGPVPVAMAARLDVQGLVPELEGAVGTAKPADPGIDTEALAAAGAIRSTEARLVVVGDSDFANNRNFADMGNGNFFLNCIAWLAQDEDLIALRPKSPNLRRVVLTKGQLAVLDIIGIGVLPGLAAVLGGIIVLRRRASS